MEQDGGRRPVRPVDEIIEEAMARGEFRDLPGKGKPLRLEAHPWEEERWLEHHILANAHFVPEWVELGREIRAELLWLRAHPEHPERAARIARLNARIDRYNLLVPSIQLQLPRYRG